jgi:hypothetical protein
MPAPSHASQLTVVAFGTCAVQEVPSAQPRKTSTAVLNPARRRELTLVALVKTPHRSSAERTIHSKGHRAPGEELECQSHVTTPWCRLVSPVAATGWVGVDGAGAWTTPRAPRGGRDLPDIVHRRRAVWHRFESSSTRLAWSSNAARVTALAHTTGHDIGNHSRGLPLAAERGIPISTGRGRRSSWRFVDGRVWSLDRSESGWRNSWRLIRRRMRST